MANNLNDDVQRWMIVNDTVMGGRSDSNLSLTGNNDIFRFSGFLSLENNGGFASVRAIFPKKFFRTAEQICIRVRGDGRRYQLRLRAGGDLDGISFVQSFSTESDQWQDLKFNIAEFEPTFRGRQLDNIRNIRPEEVRQVAFMLADKNPGEFQLDFKSIRPCSASSFV